jgi:hypothetical protein
MKTDAVQTPTVSNAKLAALLLFCGRPLFPLWAGQLPSGCCCVALALSQQKQLEYNFSCVVYMAAPSCIDPGQAVTFKALHQPFSLVI